ncbi:MAG: glutamine-scyllo-inositol transaminase, partial [uncultured bacterium]
ELHAAMLLVQLKHLEKWTEKRRQLAARYNQHLKNYVIVPEEGPQEYCVYQTYMIQADRRDELMKYLNAAGVDAKIHYPTPLYLQDAARYLCYSENDFPVTLKIASKILSLPVYTSLSFDQQDRIIEMIRKFYERGT